MFFGISYCVDKHGYLPSFVCAGEKKSVNDRADCAVATEYNVVNTVVIKTRSAASWARRRVLCASPTPGSTGRAIDRTIFTLGATAVNSSRSDLCVPASFRGPSTEVERINYLRLDCDAGEKKP